MDRKGLKTGIGESEDESKPIITIEMPNQFICYARHRRFEGAISALYHMVRADLSLRKWHQSDHGAAGHR